MVVTLQLPEQAHVRVKEGQKVTFGEPFYEVAQEEEVSISLVKPLGIHPHDIFHYTKVVVGDILHEGDIIGSKKRMLGTKTFTSTISGTVTRIDHESGSIVVSTAMSKGTSTPTFFTGEITGIDSKAHTVSLTIKDAKSFDASGEHDCGGEPTIISQEDFFSYASDTIRDRILLLHTVQSHIEAKVDALDGGGIVFVDGDVHTDVPSVHMEEDEFNKLAGSLQSYVLFSKADKKIFTYN